MTHKTDKSILISLSARRLQAIRIVLEKAMEAGEVPLDERTAIEGTIRQIRVRLARSDR